MTLASTVVAVGLVVLAGQACAPRSESFPHAHRAAVRDSVATTMALFQRYSAAAEWDSLAALYSPAPEFRFLESGAIQYSSRAAVHEALGQIADDTHIATTYRDLQIDPLAPGVAVATGLFETTFAGPEGPRFGFGGALTLIWVHEAEGWRIRSGHSSAPVPRGL